MGFGSKPETPVNTEAKRIDELNARPLPPPEQIEQEAQQAEAPEGGEDKKRVSKKALKRPVVSTITI